MSGEAPGTVYEVFETIEEVIGDYGDKRLKELIRGRDYTDADLHMARGKVQATEEIIKILRTTLGYDHTSL
jgi:hypothetical protein